MYFIACDREITTVDFVNHAPNIKYLVAIKENQFKVTVMSGDAQHAAQLLPPGGKHAYLMEY